MDRSPRIAPFPLEDLTGQTLLVEAEPGPNRTRVLEDWVRQARSAGSGGWLLPCSLQEGGPWAGVADLFMDLVAKLEPVARDLLVRHDYELVSILPALAAKLSPRNPTLTDVASAAEQVRLYPADRAFRILHGLIDLLAEWKGSADRSPWLIVCDDLDEAGFLARRFFSELMRRRGRSHSLVLVIVSRPGKGESLCKELAPSHQAETLTFQSGPAVPPEPPPSAEAMTRQARELEDRVSQEPLLLEGFLPRLIHCWSLSHTPERAARWQFEAFSSYTSRGFYLDSITYGEGALAHLEDHFPEDEARRWKIINKLFACYCTTGDPQRALHLVEGTLQRLESPKFRALAHYVLAMLHARYLPNKDFAKAEEHLEIGLADLYRANLPADELHFQVVFNRNGLAFIRYRQGAAAEAIQLCREGFETLRDNLQEDQHRLHKSVLLYNIAQVCSSLGEYEEATAHYTSAMAMDPNYAEYYNERGNLRLKKGLHEEALRDYLHAIELSPPFPEVYANLGHCWYKMNRIEDALKAFATSVDLDPHQPEIRVMMAQCHEVAGQWDQALQEYDEALEIKPDQPLVLANRACLHYQMGQTVPALTDLNRAIELAPDLPDLYQNRAVALEDLACNEEAARDLETYVHLKPDADDQAEILGKIRSLRGQDLQQIKDQPTEGISPASWS